MSQSAGTCMSAECECRELEHKPKFIVLTGGPGAGKTAALEMCRTEFADRLVIVPESATLLYSGGFPRYAQPKGVKIAQESIYLIQKALEKAQRTHYPRLSLLCDRGTVDGAVYWPRGSKEFFKAMKTTEKKEFSRYDLVLFLESAASHGDCIRSGNHYRTESPEQAAVLDQKLKLLWSKHPHFQFIARQETLQEKIKIVRTTLQTVLK